MPDDPLFDSSEIISQLRKLSFSDRRLLIIYSECESLTKTAKIYNCDKRTILKHIQEIRYKFKHTKKYD